MVAKVAVTAALEPLVSAASGTRFAAALRAPPLEVPGRTLRSARAAARAPDLAALGPTRPGTPLSKALTPAVHGVQAAQARLDRILALAQSGRSFSPAELLALQAQAYRAGNEIEV